MISKRFLLNTSAIAIATATALLPGLVRADVVLDSQAGLSACLFDTNGANCNPTDSGVYPTGTGKSVAITVQTPNWEPNNPVNPGDPADDSAIWIGAVKSGFNDPVFVASNTNNLPVYEITQTFSLVNGGELALDVWADDTTAVLLDGVQIAQLPVPTDGNSICQGTPISCTPGENGVATNVPVLGVGPHTLTFDVWQTGGGTNTNSNPTGLLYTGYVTDNGVIPTNVSTPEAGVVSTLLSMLIGVAAFAGIFKKKLA